MKPDKKDNNMIRKLGCFCHESSVKFGVKIFININTKIIKSNKGEHFKSKFFIYLVRYGFYWVYTQGPLLLSYFCSLFNKYLRLHGKYHRAWSGGGHTRRAGRLSQQQSMGKTSLQIRGQDHATIDATGSSIPPPSNKTLSTHDTRQRSEV